MSLLQNSNLKTSRFSIPEKTNVTLVLNLPRGISQRKSTTTIEKERRPPRQKRKRIQWINSRTKVLCVDVQRVLLAPSLKALALYYKTKLQTHNYTIFDLASKDVTCFIWNETRWAYASEFASCLVNYVESKGDSFDKAIIFSDGCTYQNHNRVLATALRHFCV